MANEWHYSRDGQQVGPVSGAQLKELATRGQLAPTDLVWKDGMAEWAPASKIKGLFGGAGAAAMANRGPVGATAAAPPAAAPGGGGGFVPPQQRPRPVPSAPAAPPAAVATESAPREIGYYNVAAGMGARAAATLKGFPASRGQMGEWPLDDAQLEQFATTEGYRKSIRALAGLANLLFVLSLLGLILFLVIFLLMMLNGGGSRILGFVLQSVAVDLGIAVGLTVLYYFTSRGTFRCQVWAPITLSVLFGLGVLFILGLMVFALMSDMPAFGIIPLVIALLFPLAFFSVALKAAIATPKFLACPLWAQEALVKAKL